MNIELLKKNLKDIQDLGQVKLILKDETFNQADERGVNYAKNASFSNLQTAPFCIDLVKSSNISILVDDEVKLLIENMKNLALEQSDTLEAKADNYEATFLLIGKKEGDGIHIYDSCWDDEGFEPNRYKFTDPDNYDFAFFATPKRNVTTISDKFVKVLHTVAGSSTDNSLVLIHGHTHPQTAAMAKLNNYPSRQDICASVEEALNFYQQENGTCLFLNAIINADGDLNVYGFDAKAAKFIKIDKIKYKSGEKISSYSQGSFPIKEESALT